MPRVNEAEMRRFAVAILEVSGMAGADAAEVADGLVEATKRGLTTHGVFRLPQYSQSLKGGKINARPEVRVIARRGVTAIVDADGGYGFRPSIMAMDLAIEIAREHGVGLVGVRNSHHFGAAGVYSERAARSGLIGIVTTTTRANIAPTGAMGAVVGNNPISIAVPRRPPNEPIVLDMALSQVAMGRVRVAAANGQPVPEGWGYDGQGRSTTDPDQILQGGFLAPIGEHKGYGLSFMIEILAGALTGSPFGTDADAHQNPRGGVGHYVQAIAPDFMRDREEFLNGVERLVGQVRSSPKLEEAKVFIPGEIELENSRTAARDGLRISDDLAGQLAELAGRLGVPAPAFVS